ncbi:MAG: hypothetical protein ACXVZ1_11180 [Gaiellaceae bacterium]
MRRIFIALAVLIAAVAARQASAVGPSLWIVDAGKGITNPSSGVRFAVRLRNGGTRLAAVRKRDGQVLRSTSLKGTWGLQAVTLGGTVAGLSANGRVLVLSSPPLAPGAPRSHSRFTVVRTSDLRVVRLIRLAGELTLDALSPDGRTLYLIQHLAGGDISRYRVRAYDLRRGELLPRVIVDRREGEWTMRGYPLDRVVSASAAWVYTLYQPAQGHPFIHALDTVHRSAVCVDLPLGTAPSTLDGARLTLSRDGRTLGVRGPHVGGPIAIDTRTLRIRR